MHLLNSNANQYLKNVPFPPIPQYPLFNLSGIIYLNDPAHAGLNRIGKAVFVIPPLCSQKHSHKGKTSSLKKSPDFATLQLVFFRLPLWLPLPHSFMRSCRCSSWRVSLFCSPRSVIPQSWLLLPPKPQ